MPTQFQSGQSTAKKESGEKYITQMDTATVSFADFSCKKLMLIMAILAALIAVLTVATGGAALIAIGAIAGAAGAAFGAVVGTLICGQIAAKLRKWKSGKENFKILGIPTITGDYVMLCPLFGDKITFAPEIKTWGQALAKGGANLIGGILEGMMAGALIGMGGAAIGGERAALTSGCGRGLGQAGLNFLKSAPNSIMSNFGSGMFGGAGFKALDGATNVLNVYGDTGQASVNDFTEGVRQSAQGDAEAVKNVFSGNGKVEDYVAMAMLLIPGGKKGGGNNHNSNHITSPDAPHSNKPHGDADNSSKPKDGDDGGAPQSKGQGQTETKPKKGSKGDAYEEGQLTPEELATLVSARRQTAIEFYQKHYPKMSIDDIRSHISGIDFNKPVSIVKIPKGTRLLQYTKVNTGGTTLRGDYYTTDLNATPNELGVSDKYNVQTPDRVKTQKVRQVNKETITTTKDVEGLSSTSAEIDDTWSRIDVDGNKLPIHTDGGGSQVYIPKSQF